MDTAFSAQREAFLGESPTLDSVKKSQNENFVITPGNTFDSRGRAQTLSTGTLDGNPHLRGMFHIYWILEYEEYQPPTRSPNGCRRLPVLFYKRQRGFPARNRDDSPQRKPADIMDRLPTSAGNFRRISGY